MPKRKTTQTTVVHRGNAGYSGSLRPRYTEEVRTTVVAPASRRKKRTRKGRNNRPSSDFLPQEPRTNRRANVSMRNQNMVVRHREMIGTIAMTTGFTAGAGLNGTLQPGVDITGGGNVDPNASIYSWLQPIARLHEKYRIRRMRIVYEPTCNLTTGSGTVLMSIDYDVRDSPPTSSTAMINQASGVYGPPYKEMVLNVIPQKEWLYTRSGALTTPYDLKTYDYGFLYINTDGGVVGPAGRVFVEYEIEFSLPQ